MSGVDPSFCHLAHTAAGREISFNAVSRDGDAGLSFLREVRSFQRSLETERRESVQKHFLSSAAATIPVFPTPEGHPSPSPRHTLTHTDCHTRTHTDCHTRTHRLTYIAHSHAQTVTTTHTYHTLTHAQTVTHTTIHTHRLSHNHTHRLTYTIHSPRHRLPHIVTHDHSHTTHIHTETVSHTLIQAHTDPDRHTRTLSHSTHSHTHSPQHTGTQTPSVSQFSASFSDPSPSFPPLWRHQGWVSGREPAICAGCLVCAEFTDSLGGGEN